MEKQVTPLEAMQEQAKGRVVEIPGWVPGETINVRVRQADMTASMLKAGLIGNPVLAKLKDAFDGKEPLKAGDVGAVTAPALEALEAFLPVFEAVAAEALVEPTYQQITEQVASLTLEQKMSIFDVATGGLAELSSFRRQAGGHAAPGQHGKGMGSKAK